MNSAEFAFRELETELFGVPVYSATVDAKDDVERLIRSTTTPPGSLLVVRVPSGAFDAVHRLETVGARLCDVLLTMRRRIEPGFGAADHSPRFSIRWACREDASALNELGSRAFRGFSGHWHNDTRLSPDLASELYARWSGRLARDTTKEQPVVVAETDEGVIAGFLAMVPVGENHWRVPLACVAPEHRGLGALTVMLNAAMIEIGQRGAGQLDYETQLHNGPALYSVARSGFIPAASRFTFHIWTPDP